MKSRFQELKKELLVVLRNQDIAIKLYKNIPNKSNLRRCQMLSSHADALIAEMKLAVGK